MTDQKFYIAGRSAALCCATQLLKKEGFRFLCSPDKTVTHLLLPVPSFEENGTIKGGGDLTLLLKQLGTDVTIVGGLLDRPELAGYKTIDLLRDSRYLAENACITAHCAIKVAMERLPVTFDGQNVLVIGWGRIGKCLTRLLRLLGAHVTVAARKDCHRAMLNALGYPAVDTAGLDTAPYRVVFNTVPAMVCPECPGDNLKIDLASRPGLGGGDVLWARGLPAKEAPESSGALIARTVARLTKPEGGKI